MMFFVSFFGKQLVAKLTRKSPFVFIFIAVIFTCLIFYLTFSPSISSMVTIAGVIPFSFFHCTTDQLLQNVRDLPFNPE